MSKARRRVELEEGLQPELERFLRPTEWPEDEEEMAAMFREVAAMVELERQYIASRTSGSASIESVEPVRNCGSVQE